MANVLGLFFLAIALGTQEIRKEYHLDDDKEDKQLDGDDEPQRLAKGHAAESIVIKMEHARPEALTVFLIVTHDMKVNVKQMTKLVKKIKYQKYRRVFLKMFDI